MLNTIEAVTRETLAGIHALSMDEKNKFGGSLRSYLKNPMGATLITAGRLWYDVDNATAMEWVKAAPGYKLRGDAEGISKFMTAVGKLMKGEEDTPFEVYTGEPQPEEVYIAVATAEQTADMDIRWETVDEWGNRHVTEIVGDKSLACNLLGIYTVESGFTFFGGQLASASKEDLLSYTLIRKLKIGEV